MDHARHQRRLSGPLLDRIDVRIDVTRPDGEALAGAAVTDSATVRAAVAAARECQGRRLTGTRALCNADMDGALIRRVVQLDERAQAVLGDAYDRSHLSARGHERILKVARTIADLDGDERVTADHVHRALSFRGEPQRVEVPA
jgi:magnesium chelatase family protein